MSTATLDDIDEVLDDVLNNVRSLTALTTARAVLRRASNRLGGPSQNLDEPPHFDHIGSKPGGGYPVDLFPTRPPQEFICAICLEVARDAMKCKNEHLFCERCIQYWVVEKGNERCPLGNERLKWDDLSIYRMPTNMIADLEIRCTTSSTSDPGPELSELSCAAVDRPPRCEWIGQIKTLEDHLAVCSFEHVPCPIEGCPVRPRRRNLAQHCIACSYTLTPCTNGCGCSVARNGMSAHRGTDCVFEVIDCPFKESFACSYRIARKDMHSHANDAAAHLMCMSQKMAEMQRNESTMKTTIEKLEKKVADMHSLFELERKVRKIERDKEDIEKKIRDIQAAKQHIESTTNRMAELENAMDIAKLEGKSDGKSSGKDDVKDGVKDDGKNDVNDSNTDDHDHNPYIQRVNEADTVEATEDEDVGKEREKGGFNESNHG